MSKPEVERLALMQQIHERRVTQRKAAEVLRLSQRQVERLYAAYKRSGPQALASKKRGRPSNRRLPQSVRETALGLVRKYYTGFGPTLANEKLRERHALRLSTETLRQWMVAEELWVPHVQRRERVHQPRRRRECFGELVQIDGCDHEWFEDRGPRCVALVFVDDATSSLMALHFCESESAFTYFDATRKYLEQHGKPVAFYSDKASVFRVNSVNPSAGDGVTQFGRALGELNIDIICANSAPAKGRVERAHQTLQDRLVKELRLRGICTVDAANVYAPEFTEDYNQRFAKAPRHDFNAHRPLHRAEELDEIFLWQEKRTVTKNLTFNFQRSLYVIENSADNRALVGKRITVYEAPDGSIRARGDRGFVKAARFFKDEARITQGAIVSNKHLASALRQIKERQEALDEEKLKSLRSRRERRLLQERAARAASEPPTPSPHPD